MADNVGGAQPGEPEHLKTLLEFMRIKAPELNIRQIQLARIVFFFVIANVLLFLIVFNGVGSVSFSLNNNAEIQNIFSIANPRPFIILGTTFFIFFLFMRFGYLYYQGTKDIVSVHNAIGIVLPLAAIRGTYLEYVRESLLLPCKANYIIQSIVVFMYPKDESKGAVIKFEDGPLSGSNRLRVIIVKFLMMAMTVCAGWFIAISQFMMILVFLTFTNAWISFLILVTFVCYYLFYFEYVAVAARNLRDLSMACLAVLSAGIIVLSVYANLVLLWNSSVAPNVFECRVSLAKVDQLSPSMAVLIGFLFDKKLATQTDDELCRKVDQQHKAL